MRRITDGKEGCDGKRKERKKGNEKTISPPPINSISNKHTISRNTQFFVITLMPSFAATITYTSPHTQSATVVAMLMNRPWSTTPVICLISRSTSSGWSIPFGKRKSMM